MNFNSFGFKKFINDRIKVLNFTIPTPIQNQVIPLLQKHHNLIAQAPTGTGKSHAFLLPLINNLNAQKAEEVQLIIFTPTQELGEQLLKNVKFLIHETNFKAALYTKSNANKISTSKQPTIVIGTPERLYYLYQKQDIKLTTAQAIVVDEADMIFTAGFIENLDFLISKMSAKTQIAFFSATINPQLQQYLKKYVKNSFFVDVKPKAKSLTTHYYIEVGKNTLFKTLSALMEHLNPYLGLIFVNNKGEIKSIHEKLKKLNFGPIAELHGDLDARVRTQTMKRIRHGDFKYILVSDLAARGLDIPGASHVISLGLPKNLAFYWHRSGRVGRNQTQGESYLLANDQDLKALKILEKKGIKFIPLKLTADNHLVYKKNSSGKNKLIKTVDPELNKLIGSFANKKIKPNYRKKQKQAIDQLTRDRKRREAIAAMRRNKKKKYKKRRSLLFD